VTRICPACQGELEVFIYEGSRILKCRQCEGVLVKEDAIAGILQRKQYVFDERIKNMARVVKDERALGKYEPLSITESDRRYCCDQCKNRNQKMRKCLFNRFYHVEIDKCMACGLTWFDKDELEIMQCIFETRDAESRR
jgi:Zn-finger nucleic acid-binding protein